MLPGFRFLFAATVLSISLLIFGLGAAALLRAAHEEFASIPSRRAPPETIFAQRSDTGPALAMLRAEPAAVDEKAVDPSAADNAQDQPAIVATPAEPEKPAAEPDKIAALTEPEAATSEIAGQAGTPVQADVPSSGAETKVAAIAEVASTAPNQAAVTAPEQASVPIDDSTRIAETRIATLGGPPVTIETPTPSKIAPAAVKKQAKAVVKRRRIARRAPVMLQASQKPADPFAPPRGR